MMLGRFRRIYLPTFSAGLRRIADHSLSTDTCATGLQPLSATSARITSRLRTLSNLVLFLR